MSKYLLNPASTLCGALALELSSPAAKALILSRDNAGALAREQAQDLVRFDPRVRQLSISTVGVHYDPVELLRPDWSLWAELDQLGARAPNQDSAQVIAFAAHAGTLPGKLMPENDHLGGALRVVPFVLRGDADTLASVSARFECDLVEHGMASAQTALMAQEAFAVKIEHARYLTRHDLCAMTALQYEHAGLAALWPLIETALLSPEREQWLDIPPEPLLGWCKGHVKMVELTKSQWQMRYAANLSASEKARLYVHFQARQRQFISVLAAHAISVHKIPFSDVVSG